MRDRSNWRWSCSSQARWALSIRSSGAMVARVLPVFAPALLAMCARACVTCSSGRRCGPESVSLVSDRESPGLASWEILSRPFRDWSWLSCLPRTTSWAALSRPLRQAQGRPYGTGLLEVQYSILELQFFGGLVSCLTTSRRCGERRRG